DTLIGLDGRDDLRGGKGHDVLVGDGSVTPALLSLNDGSNNTDRLQAQGAGVLPTGDLTFEMLINAADPGTQEACLFSYASSSAVSNAFTLFNSNQQLRIIVNNTVVDTGVPTSELMNGTANRISVTLDADTDTMQLFVNGAIMWQGVEPAIGAGLATGGILVIGQDQDTLGGGFNPNQATDGAVGDIRVWNSVRSARDIAEAAQTGVPADAIGLSAYWVVGDDGRMDPLVGPDMALIGPGGVTPAGTTGGSDVLRGGQGDDQLFGGDGNDTLDGGADNDTLEGGRGSDRLDGGNGLDVASYADTGVALRVDLNDATQNTGRAASDTLISIEGVIGSQGDDTLFGSDEGNILRGSGGDDRIVARGGDDTLSGGEGADILDGNGGDDWVDFTGEGSVTADLQFNARNLGSAAGDEYRRIEHLMAGDGDDDLRGDGTDNSISGGDGADTLTGRGGADVILGGAGRDTLEGGAGADVLVGGGDTNLLYGGSGADTLRHGVADGGPRGNDDWYGGSGADIFEFDNTTEDDHFAHIWDFGRGSDTIRIIGAEYDDLTIGDVDSQKAYVILEQNTLVFVEGVQAADLTEDKFEFV
ncbi:MAG: LamG-like jellyroll fold domain-containing protein, partial [Pseudomonadota bacterium]